MADIGSDKAVVELKLAKPIDRQLADDIERQFVYVSPHVLRLSVSASGETVVAELDSAGPPVAETIGKVSRFLQAMTKDFRKIEQGVHFNRDTHRCRSSGGEAYDELRRRGWLFEHGQGQVSLSGPPLNALNVLDRRFADIYRTRFGATDRSYPAMISADLLARCGYFEMHPNAVSFVSHVVEDYDELEAFRRANVGQSVLTVAGGHTFSLPKFCLNPAACFPCYETLEGTALAPQGTALSWRGRVFRYESRNIAGLDRLWEFNVRELVFLGTDAFVQAGRSRTIEAVTGLFDEWDLDCRIETATDPFFATVYAARSFWQQVSEAKYEVRAKVEDIPGGASRTIAVGSFNLHGQFFGERFHIGDHDGHAAASGCVGFGLERLMFCLFAQHGLEASDWPPSLRAEVFG